MNNTTLYGLTTEHVNKLKELAYSLGYVAERGAAYGQGSASALIRAIAEGELTVYQPPSANPARQQLWEILCSMVDELYYRIVCC